jgi:hypothetical protein
MPKSSFDFACSPITSIFLQRDAFSNDCQVYRLDSLPLCPVL